MIDPDFYPRALRRAASLSGVTPYQMRSESRRREVVRARWAIWLCLKRRGHTAAAIGRRAARDHTTVHYALDQAQLHESIDPCFAELVREVAAA